MTEQDGRPQFLIVVGASAGGLNALIELCAQLDKQMDAAVCVVLHISHISMADILAQRIQRSSSFRCKIAEDGELLQRHHIYMAEANRHLLVKKNRLLLGQGPAENRWRPSIDTLFRSAAVAYAGHTIGLILTGLLRDGTTGMLAIKKSGGLCIVQDPKEAEYPDMPQAVLDNVDVDYCVSLSQMGLLLKEKTSLVHEIAHGDVPQDIRIEAAIAERVAIGVGIEATLWVALRMMEERRQLLVKMADEENNKGRKTSACNNEERALDLKVHIDRLKQILFDTQLTRPSGSAPSG